MGVGGAGRAREPLTTGWWCVCGQGRRRARAVARGGAIAATAAAASTSNRTLTKMQSKHYPLSDFAIKTHTSVPCKHICRHFTPRETLTCCAHVAGAATIKSHFERECRVHPAAGPCFHVTSHYKFRFGWHRLGAREPEPRRSRLRGYGREHANECDPSFQHPPPQERAVSTPFGLDCLRFMAFALRAKANLNGL